MQNLAGFDFVARGFGLVVSLLFTLAGCAKDCCVSQVSSSLGVILVIPNENARHRSQKTAVGTSGCSANFQVSIQSLANNRRIGFFIKQ